MGVEIRPDNDQIFLLPPSLEDWVGDDHPARFIRDFADSLDLEELGFRIPEAIEGRPPYAADLLLKVWLYGYMNKVRSSRKLERACREHMSLVWLTGMNYPDHNALWRFWAINRKALRELDKMGRDHLHPNDRDARMMKYNRGIEFAYNAQAVVDSKNGLIVAQDVVNAKGDTDQLVPMLKDVERNLGEAAEETVCRYRLLFAGPVSRGGGG